VHGTYSRDEISAGLVEVRRGKLLRTQGGVYKCDAHRCDVLYVTLEKDEKDFTPTTLYNDYPMSQRRFHWETQSVTREESSTGLRYRSPPQGWRFLLFVRHRRHDDRGMTSPFLCLGPVAYLGHEGERPMRITWALREPMPGEWYQRVKIAGG
jgi:hypothetical protein